MIWQPLPGATSQAKIAVLDAALIGTHRTESIDFDQQAHDLGRTSAAHVCVEIHGSNFESVAHTYRLAMTNGTISVELVDN